MLLAIDIGNSFTKFALFSERDLISRSSIPTLRNESPEGLSGRLAGSLFRDVRSCVISSVVPELEETYFSFIASRIGSPPVFVSSSLDFGFPIIYQPPESLGTDRMVAAFAAREKYGKPCVVCDFGTATKIDAISLIGEFIGGAISPGIGVMADSLHLKTAKLPRISIEKPSRAIGDSTAKAISSGIYFGAIGSAEGLIARISNELGGSPKVIATGGYAGLIAQGTTAIDVTDENLLLHGLRIIHEKLNAAAN